MRKTRIFLFLSIISIIIGFTGCNDDTGNGNGNGNSYAAITTLDISGGSNLIGNNVNQTLITLTNDPVHSSLTIVWTNNNNNAVKFVVNGIEENTATGPSVTIRGKLVTSHTSIRITAAATTTHPTTGEKTTISANKYITVIPEGSGSTDQVSSAQWRFDIGLAQSLGLPNNATNTDRYDVLTERALDTRMMTGGINAGVSLIPITTGSNILQFRPGTTAGVSGGSLQPSGGNNVAWGKITGIPNGVKIGVEFKFTDSGNPTDQQTLADRGVDRYPIITLGTPPTSNAANPQQHRDGTVFVQGQASAATANIEVTSTGADIFLGIKENIRIFEIKITILESPALTSLALTTEKNSIYETYETTLTYTRTPLGAAGELVWEYDYEYFHLIYYGNGTAALIGLKPTPGALPVKILLKDNPAIFSTVNITVNSTDNAKFVEDITITPSSAVTIFAGGADPVNYPNTVILGAEITPSDADNKDILWISEHTAIATVHPATGLVTAVAKGTATIRATATDTNSVSKTKQVNVVQLATSIDLGGENNTVFLKSGETRELRVLSLKPDNEVVNAAPTTLVDADRQAITWSSDNTAIASFETDGKTIKANTPGTATITAAAVGGAVGRLKIEVVDFPTLGTNDRHWDFVPNNAANSLTAYTDSNSPTVAANVEYLNNMILLGARRNGGRWIPAQTAANSDLLTVGCYQTGGATTANNNFLMIRDVSLPARVVVFYSGTSNEQPNNVGRTVSLYRDVGFSNLGAAGTGGTLVHAGTGSNGTQASVIDFSFAEAGITNIGLQCSGGVRIHDIFIYYPPATAVFVSSDKTTIMAGVTDGAIPETAQITAIQGGQNINTSVTWHLRSTNTFGDTNVPANTATISGGVLTAGLDLTADTDIYVFAEKDENQSSGIKITIKKWEEAQIPTTVIYNFSDFDTGTISATVGVGTTIGGLTFGNRAEISNQNGTINGVSYTRCYRPAGNYVAGERFLAIPVEGPATIRIIGTANAGSAINVLVNGTKTSNAAPLITTLSLIGQASSVTYETLPTITVSAAQATGGMVVLWPAANVRIFRIEVHYD